MAVKSYKRSDRVQLAKNFKLDEFKCKCGKCDPIWAHGIDVSQQ